MKRISGLLSRMRIVPTAILIAAGLLAGCGADVQFGKTPSPPAKKDAPAAKGLPASPGTGGASAKVETRLGSFELELDADRAPLTVANFLRYAEDGYYSGTTFHQVVPDVMIVGGSHNAEFERKSEGLRDPIASEWSPAMKNLRGTIGLYRKPGDLDSAQAEFYINLRDNPRLDEPQDGAGYVVFGRVTDGMDVVEQIGAAELGPHPENPGGPAIVPAEPVVIEGIEPGAGVDIAALEAEGLERLAKEKSAKEAEVQEIIQKTKEEFGVDFTTTDSGLKYATLRAGEGPTPPSSSSTVKVHYVGTLTNGKKFDSSYDRNAPATFPLNRVIPGWTEGVGSMQVGEKRRLIIPSDLGYGDRGAPPDIPGGATLVFDVELLEIQ